MTEISSPLWHLELLGEMCLTRPDAPDGAPTLRFRSRKTAALLALLALRRGPHRREALAEMLWPETDPIKARSSLRVALSSLRSLLETSDGAPDAILQISRESVTLGAALTSDVERFRQTLSMARAASSADSDARRAGLEDALGWYRGPLAIAAEADELAVEASRLEDEFVEALLKIVAAHRTQERMTDALQWAQNGLKKAPLREEISLEILSLSLALKIPEAARDFKKWCARAEKQGVSVANSTRQRALALENPARQDLPSHTTVAPSSQSVDGASRASNGDLAADALSILPPVWTKFFGREAEIVAHGELLRGGARLLTLIGAGGAGKSALALQIARRLATGATSQDSAGEAAEFGLVAWVSLAELPVAARIPAALAQSLGAGRGSSRLAPIAALRAARTRRGARILLVLDGFEHLCDDGAPLVREWLDAMPELTCLLSSRRTLGFAGEMKREVLPLEFGAPSEFETASRSVAAALFLDRAQLARPAWSPTPEEERIVEDLCARLEGLPLALEIAAARLSLFALPQILAEIEAPQNPNQGDSIEFPSVLSWKNTDRAAPARQTNLRASIAWSERQLPLAAARFWRQISVFRGGFSLEAASQICECDAAPLVMTLVEASLLRLDTSGAGARALQLEIERQYAATLLGKAETAALEARHAEYFSSWSAAQNPDSPLFYAEKANVERALFGVRPSGRQRQ